MTEVKFNKSTAREYFESLTITVILALFGTTFIVQAFKIPTPSMEDNLLVGDHLLVNKFAYGAPGFVLDDALPLREIRRGDIIVFKFPRDVSKHYVKRVIGLPGDRIRVEDDQVSINGHPLKESYKRLKPDFNREPFPPLRGSPSNYQYEGVQGWYEPFRQKGEIVVPEGQYFAMGDNRDDSLDSRYWGFVPRSLIVGKALVIYWSYESDTAAYRQTGVRNVVWQTLDLVKNFFGKTRWTRTFRIIR
jgi:signal peptidase I